MLDFIEKVLRMPRVVLTVMVLILAAGTAAYVGMPKESFPAIEIPYLYVSISQSGVSPSDAENLLAKMTRRREAMARSRVVAALSDEAAR